METIQASFDQELKLEFHGVKVTSDAGLLAYRELDNTFSLKNMVASELIDKGTGKRKRALTPLIFPRSPRPAAAGRQADKETNEKVKKITIELLPF